MADHDDNSTLRPTVPATTDNADVRVIDETGVHLPMAPVSAFSEADFEPKETEFPSQRWRRRGWRTLLPVLGATLAAVVGMSIVNANPGYKGLGLAALFCAPTIIGTIISLFPSRKANTKNGTHIGHGVLASFLATLLGLPLAGEGAICLVFALPVTMSITMVTSVVAVNVLNIRLARLDAAFKALLAIFITIVLPLSVAPIDQYLFFDDSDRATVTSSVTVPWSQERVWDSLRHLEVEFAHPGPFTIDAMLPMPTALVGAGAAPGAVRRVEFDNGTVTATVVDLHEPDRYVIDLQLENPGREFFDHWVNLKRARFDLVAVDPDTTTLIHTTTYQPLLYPRVVFAPLERFFGGVIQQRLVDVYAADVLSKARPTPQVASAR